MALLIGAVAWGLITFAAIGHLWHHDRLVELLAVHTDHERPAARALVAIELVLSVSVPVALFASARALAIAGIALTVLGVAFTAWIARLLATDSALPCACSFSAGPTSPWSLVRAVLLLGAIGLVASIDTTTSETLVVFATGFAIAGAIYVVPESLSWPEVSRAHLARIDSHRPLSNGDIASARSNPAPPT